MRKVWGKKEAVSPVIAVILMVAITVVLAAVLYIMVSGMITTTTTSPHVTLSNWVKDSATSGHIDIADVDQTKPCSDYKFIVIKGSDTITVSTGPSTAGGKSNQTGSISGTSVTVTVTDLTGEGKLSGGDRITISTTAAALPSGDWELKVIYIPTGDEVGRISWTI